MVSSEAEKRKRKNENNTEEEQTQSATAFNQTASKQHPETRCKTVAKSSHRTPLPKASNSKTQAVAVDAKSPKHHLDTRRKTAKTRAKKLFHVTFGIHKNNLMGLPKSGLDTASESLEQQNTGPKASNSKTQAVALEVKSPKHHLDTSRKRPKPDPKNPVAKSGLRTPLPKASNNKTQAVALDAKSPKHNLDTSRKRPKPEPKNLFHVTFGIHKNNLLGLAKSGLGNIASESLEQQNTSPKASNNKTRCKTVAKSSPRTPLPKASNSKTQAVAVDAKSPKHHLGHKPRNGQNRSQKNSFTLPLESTTTIFWASRNLALRPRCEKSQTPSGHEPKTAKTGAKKLFHVTFGIHKNIFSASRNLALDHRFRKPRTAKHKPESLAQQNTLQNCRKSSLEQQNTSPKASNSKTRSGLGALDAKSPKHHLDTSRKQPKPEPKNSFTLPLESTKTSFGPREIWPLEHRPRKPRTAKHKPESLEQQNTLQN